MKLAWFNLAHDRARFLVAVMGIAFAVFLMIFQGSLLVSFLQAASKVIEATDADIWITGRGVSCFDFAAPLPDRFVKIAQGVNGVAHANRLLSNYARFHSPNGQSQFVLLIGVEPETGPSLPLPMVRGTNSVVEPHGVLIDRSHTMLLGVSRFPQEIEINRRRAKVMAAVNGFSSFLGSPYVFASYQDASQYLDTAPEETSFILVRVEDGQKVAPVLNALRRRLPDVDVLTKSEFAYRAKLYWVTQTGAGGAILMAALLGFFIGIVVASQTMYAATMDKLEEYATLKALGASRFYVIRIVLIQALICGIAGSILGVVGTQPMVEAVRGNIAWLNTPVWLPWSMVPVGIVMCCLAAMVSIRTALNVEPARVFRA